MKKNTLTLGLGLCALAPLPALAQDALMLDEIVASAGLIPVEVNRTGATVETLDQDEIAEGGQDVGQTLARLPGVSLTSNGGLGTTSTLRLRGLGGSYIGVRIDGMDISDPSSTQTAFNFGTLTAGLPDRIEVLKGAQSALYGSSAIAGVVDITTWRPETLGFSGAASVEVGSYGTSSGTLNLGQMSERGEIALSYSHVTTDGFSARNTDTEDDGFEQDLLTLYAAYDVTDTLRLGFSALYSDGTSDFDRSATDPTGSLDETRKGLRAFAQFTTGAVEHEFAVSRVQTNRFDAGGFTRKFQGDRTKVDYLGTTDLGTAAKLAFGAEWSEEKATLDGTRISADSSAVFSEVQYAASDAIDLSFSLRYDAYSDFDNQLSGRGALAWRMRDDLILRAVLGTGYRAPSLYERFGPFGTPTLSPETSRSAEIGIEKRYDNGSFAKATVFYAEIDDLIDYDFGLSAYNQVPGTTRSSGIELSGRYALSDTLAVFGNYTYTDATNPGGRALRVPRNDLIVGVEATLSDRLKGQMSVQRVTGQVDYTTYPTVDALDDYTLVNAGVSYDFTDRAQGYLRVENLLDEEYEPLRGYNASGRALYVGLRASF
ncbi:MAG: TonB-dependent receptor [Rhodobacteraceae bacterium]|nr:TonB-dependent receptor [Paracoccaceae bacterium]